MSKDLYIDRIVYDYIVPEIKYQLTNSAFTKREQRKAIPKRRNPPGAQ